MLLSLKSDLLNGNKLHWHTVILCLYKCRFKAVGSDFDLCITECRIHPTGLLVLTPKLPCNHCSTFFLFPVWSTCLRYLWDYWYWVINLELQNSQSLFLFHFYSMNTSHGLTWLLLTLFLCYRKWKQEVAKPCNTFPSLATKLMLSSFLCKLA